MEANKDTSTLKASDQEKQDSCNGCFSAIIHTKEQRNQLAQFMQDFNRTYPDVVIRYHGDGFRIENGKYTFI